MSDTEVIWLRNEAERTALDALAAAAGYQLCEDQIRAHSEAATRSWSPPGPDKVAALGYCENHVLGVRFVWAPAELMQQVRAALPHHSREALLAAASVADPREALPALRVLGAMERKDLSAETLALLTRWMGYKGDGHPAGRLVRQAVLNLCWTGRWQQLVPHLTKLAAEDEELAQEWRALLDELTAAGSKPAK